MGAHKTNPVARYYAKHPEYKGKDKLYNDVIERELPHDLMEWQSGAYRYYRLDCRTEDGYYNYVGSLVEKYKELTETDVVLFRSTAPYEDCTHLGCSWTPDLQVCKEKAAFFKANEIYTITIPKGTPVVHLSPNGFYEEEFILDMKGLGLVGKDKCAELIRARYSVGRLYSCASMAAIA